MALKDAADALAKEGDSTEKLRELLEKVEPKIEQVHQLYRQYFSGTERMPPKVQHEQLALQINTLKAMSKPTPSLKFRFEGIHARYLSYKNQWEKKLKAMESSKKR